MTSGTPGTGPVPLTELAALIAGYQWLEGRLFEVMGGWARSVPEPAAKVALSTHAYRRGEHALAWEGLAPTLPAGTVRPPGPAPLGGLVDAVAGSQGNVDRLVGAYRVLLPAVARLYQAHLGRVTAVADAPVALVLRLAGAEAISQAVEGEALLVALLGDDGLPEAAARRQVELDMVAGQELGLPASNPTSGP